MSKDKVLKFQIYSAIFVSILGTLLHFTYEWSNENFVVGLFSAVNESTWEHLKLLFYPMLITTIIGYLYIGKEKENFLCAKTLSIITSIVFTIIFFYSYVGIIGKNIDIINILSFFVAVVLGEYVSYKLILSNKFVCDKKVAIITLIILLLFFVIFTFFTPKIGLFRDPITGKYGI